MEDSVSEFLKSNIKVEAEIKRVWLVGRREERNKAVVELQKWE